MKHYLKEITGFMYTTHMHGMIMNGLQILLLLSFVYVCVFVFWLLLFFGWTEGLSDSWI